MPKKSKSETYQGSTYAKNVIERGPNVTAWELDRLQRKINFYENALRALHNATGRSRVASYLEQGEKL